MPLAMCQNAYVSRLLSVDIGRQCWCQTKTGRLALVGFVCVCVCVWVRVRAAIDTLVVDSVIYYRGQHRVQGNASSRFLKCGWTCVTGCMSVL